LDSSECCSDNKCRWDCCTDNNCGPSVLSCEAGGFYIPTSAIIVVGTSSGETCNSTKQCELGGTPALSGYVEIYKSGQLQDNKTFTTSSGGKFSVQFGPFSEGTYFVNVTAGSAVCTDYFAVITPTPSCVEKTITLSGAAYDSTTGEIIPSGTAKVAIQETGDEREESFTNGEWSVTFTSCFVSSNRYNAAVKITDVSGKASYSQIQFITP
jgi:hypothetical protein